MTDFGGGNCVPSLSVRTVAGWNTKGGGREGERERGGGERIRERTDWSLWCAPSEAVSSVEGMGGGGNSTESTPPQQVRSSILFC